jgi:hypothetical protein
VHPPHAKIFRAIPHASAVAIPVPVSSARSAVDAIVTVAAEAVPTAVAGVPTAAVIGVAARAQAVRDSNAVPAAPVARVTIMVIAAIPDRRAVRNSFLKC